MFMLDEKIVQLRNTLKFVIFYIELTHHGQVVYIGIPKYGRISRELFISHKPFISDEFKVQYYFLSHI